jgi:hypothetical protein
MARQLLGVVALGLALIGCSSTPLGEDTQGATEREAVGSVSLPLLTTTAEKVTYRLRLATFTIAGPALGGKPRVIKPLADIEVHNESLPVGSYSITLEKGWVLERRAPEATEFKAVSASLVTPNPMVVDITGKEPAQALFGFATTSGDVSLGTGSVDIRIGVQECNVYDSYMASLGTLTANCLGTTDPRVFSLNADGFLVPTFDKCLNDDGAMRSINQILSLQYKSARLPNAKACLAGRYRTALAKFVASDIQVCPSLRFVQTENPITADVISKVETQLPALPSNEPLPRGILDGDQPALKTFNLYQAFFETSPPAQACQGASDCAMACASTFPGFAVSITKTPAGLEVVRTDPDSWLETTTYGSQAQDPYLKFLFYHPMSYYGDPPGVQFGDPHRALPCGLNPTTGAPKCDPEACSYHNGTSHTKVKLQLDCNDYTNPSTCTSYCGPPLPPPPSLPTL